jgi:hypothetical protein
MDRFKSFMILDCVGAVYPTMHPKLKAPQEPTVKARTKGLVEAFDISDRSDEDLLGEADTSSV